MDDSTPTPHARPRTARALVEAYFDTAFRDPAGLIDLLGPDVTLTVPEPLPYAGVYEGADGYRAALEAIGRSWEAVEVHDLRLLGDHGEIVALTKMVATARATGQRVEAEIAERFRIEDGRIAEVRAFYADPVALARVLVEPSAEGSPAPSSANATR